MVRPLTSVSGARVSLTVRTAQRTLVTAVFRWSATLTPRLYGSHAAVCSR